MSDVWSAWEAVRAAADAPPLAAIPAALPDPAAIPPREWLYGTRLIRRFVSLLVAPGGVGKTALALGQAAAVATGRGFLGEHVHRSVPVWVLNLEDPLDELHRRLAALMRHHGLTRAELEGRLFLHSGRTRRVVMAEIGAGGMGLVHPDRAAIVAACHAWGIGLLVIDPFVKSHRLDENSNAQIDGATTAWGEVAEETGASVLLVHHVRKGGSGTGAIGDVEAARGAKSLSDAARAASILSPMSIEEAARLSVPPTERWRHVRLDDAKANLAPRAETALWYRLESVPLGNATPEYPSGDMVAVVAPWKRPAFPAAMTASRCNAALDRIAAGPEPGHAYTAHRGGKGGGRWAGLVLVEAFGLSEAEAARTLAAWIRSGLLVECAYRDPARRKSRLGLRVVDASRPSESASPHPFETDP